MAYDPAAYFTTLADEAEANGQASTAAHLRVMASEAKAKARAAKAAERASRKPRQRPLMGFAASGRGFIVKPY